MPKVRWNKREQAWSVFDRPHSWRGRYQKTGSSKHLTLEAAIWVGDYIQGRILQADFPLPPRRNKITTQRRYGRVNGDPQGPRRSFTLLSVENNQPVIVAV